MYLSKIFLRTIMGCFLFFFGRNNNSAQEVSVNVLHDLLEKDSNLVLIDVRSPQEFQGEMEKLEQAINVELGAIEDSLGYLSQFKGKDIYVICRGGVRSNRAATKLKENGFNAINVSGGMMAYRKEYPLGKE